MYTIIFSLHYITFHFHTGTHCSLVSIPAFSFIRSNFKSSLESNYNKDHAKMIYSVRTGVDDTLVYLLDF